MDGLTFTSEVIKALAWPTAAVVIVVLLREPLGKLLVLLKKVKYGELEAEFGDELVEKAKKEADETLPAQTAKAVTAVGGAEDEFLEVATAHPAAAVQLGMNELNTAARHALHHKGVKVPPDAPPQVLMAQLYLNEMVSVEQYRLLNLLLEIWLLTTRRGDEAVSPQAARQFLELVERMKAHLMGWHRVAAKEN